jgi:hypothetical protein
MLIGYLVGFSRSLYFLQLQYTQGEYFLGVADAHDAIC